MGERPSPDVPRARRVALIFAGLGAIAGSPAAVRAEVPAATVHEITVEPPRPLALLVLTPGGAPATTSAGRLAELVARRLVTRTRLEARRVPAERASGCRGALACIIAGIGAERPPPASDADARDGAEWLLILSLRARGEGEEGVTALLVDLREARAVEDDDAEGVEAQLFSRAVRASPPPYTVRGPEELEVMVDDLLFGALREALSSAGELRGLGELEVELGAAAALVLDGRPLGQAPPGLTRIRGVPAGPHHLKLEQSAWTGEEVLEVRAAEVTRARGEPPPPPSAAPAVRTAFLWGGATVFAVGATLVGVAAARSGAGWGICVSADPAVVDGCSTERFVHLSSGTVTPGTRGVLLAPLGASVALTGVGALLGALVDDGDSPWIGLLTGLAAGLATYGAAVLLEPTPEAR